MGLSTHILDTAMGKPVAGVNLTLLQRNGDRWTEIGCGETDDDGRCRTLLGDNELEASSYRIRFEVAPYFAAQNLSSLYPYIEITFAVHSPEQHFHIPLLLAANGYTTYRGS